MDRLRAVMKDPSLVDDALEQALHGDIDAREDARIEERSRALQAGRTLAGVA